MSTAATAISKRVRFEIFKRDAFTCQYCGRKPPEVVLEIDHIDPRCNGGTNEKINLVSACFDCNRGKAGKTLMDFPARPDADLEYLKSQQEIGEAKRFLCAKKELDELREELVVVIQDHWHRTLQTGTSVPADKVIVEWLLRYNPDEIIYAIDNMLPRMRHQYWRFNEQNFTNCIRYISGILRNRKEAKEDMR